MIRTILVGADGRPSGDDAMAVARRLSQLDDARIVVAFAYRNGRDGAELAAIRALARIQAHAADSENVDYVLAPGGSTAEALASAATLEGADAVVIGSSHHGPTVVALTGSTLAALARLSDVPIVVAPRGYASRPPGAWTRVVLAVDTSAASEAAASFAADLAGATEEPLLAVDVLSVDALPALERRPDGSIEPASAQRADALDAATRRAAERLASRNVSVRTRRAFGAPEQALTRESEDLDLLICGVEPRGPVDRLVHGGVSEAVAQHAGCPVVLVPAAHSPAA